MTQTNPQLLLLAGDAIDVDALAKLYEMLTGKKPTAKELTEVAAELAGQTGEPAMPRRRMPKSSRWRAFKK